jgi:hypothetical protein
MGSDPTLAHDPGIRRGRHDDQADERYGLGGRGELLAHLQTAAALGGHEFGDWPQSEIGNGFRGDLAARHRHDHTRLADQFPHAHPERASTLGRAEGEQAFTRLNRGLDLPAGADVVARAQAQLLEDHDTRSPRVVLAERLENDQPTEQRRQQVIAGRARLARQRAAERAAERDAVGDAERAFDRLNPEFGVPADHDDPIGHRDVQQREAALSLGPRVAVAAMRENDRDPAIWLAGQDYRAADAARAASQQPTRARRDPARAGAER